MFRHLQKSERSLITAFLIIFIGCFIYANSFQVRFQLDDISVIVRNAHLRDPSQIADIFRYDPTRFLSHLTFALNYYFHGLDHQPYHLVNLLIHIACAVLVFHLVARTLFLASVAKIQDTQSVYLISFFCSLIFLAHPIQTESVTYIVQRSTLIASVCYLLSLVLYLKLKENFNGYLYALSLAVIVAGVMAKPIFITLPLMILLYEICFFDLLSRLRTKGNRRKAFLLFLPYLSVAVVIPLFLMMFTLNYFSESFDVSKLTYATRVTSQISRWDYLLTQSRVLLTYLRLLIVPANQNLDYDYPLSQTLFEPRTFLSCLAIIALLVVALRLLRSQRIFAFAIFWFFIVLIPESSIFPIPDIIFEHRLYMAVVGFALCLCVALYYLVNNRQRYAFYLALLIVSFSIMTYARNWVWQNPVILWQDVVKKSPLKPRPHHILGDIYFEQRLWDLAQAEYKKAIALDKDYLQAYNNLGKLYQQKGNLSDAMVQFRKVLDAMPEHFEANVNLGNIYYQNGQWDLAAAQFKKAASMMPRAETPYLNLGNIYARLKKFPQAKEYYEKALAGNPRSFASYYALGNLDMEQQQFSSAIGNYEKAIVINPRYVDAHNTLGIAYAALENFPKAEIYFQRAVALRPDHMMAYLNLARVSQALGKAKQTKMYADIALELKRRQKGK